MCDDSGLQTCIVDMVESLRFEFWAVETLNMDGLLSFDLLGLVAPVFLGAWLPRCRVASGVPFSARVNKCV